MKRFIFIPTPLGKMVAAGSNSSLCFLKFHDDRKDLNVEDGYTPILHLIEMEVKKYFEGTLEKFTTPIELVGTNFQKEVWKIIQTTRPGTLLSYLQLASLIKRENAARAVAQCCKANRFNLIIPCHRIIRSSGQIGGYNGGSFRKQALIEKEKSLFKEVASLYTQEYAQKTAFACDEPSPIF